MEHKKIKNKAILLIGGGVLQFYSISIARAKGLEVFLADGSEKCYCKNFVDKFFCIDTKNYIEITKLSLDLKKNFNLVAIYTQGTDVSYTVSYAAKKCNFYGLKPIIAKSIENKILMRQKLKNTKLGNVNFFIIKKDLDLFRIEKKIKYPVYVKPADNCASRGIKKVKNFKEMKAAYIIAKESSIYSKEVLVESAIEGVEYSVDTIVYNKKVINCGISDRNFIKNSLYSIQSGSTTPSSLSRKTQIKMINLMQEAAKIFNINNSAFKGDLILDNKNNVKIIELATRTSGGFDAQVRKPCSFGIDIISATMDLAINNNLDYHELIPKWIKWSRTISVFPNKGKVIKILGLEWLKKQKYIVDKKIFVKKGSMINKLYDSGSRTNFITIIASDINQLNVREKAIRSNFKIIVNGELR